SCRRSKASPASARSATRTRSSRACTRASSSSRRRARSRRRCASLNLWRSTARVDARFGVDSATLRALLMFSLDEAQLVRFDGLSVVEIGGGIGSFAAAVLTLSSPESYAIYDLPDMLA